MTLSGTTAPGQSGPGSNGNEVSDFTIQSAKTGVLPSDAVLVYSKSHQQPSSRQEFEFCFSLQLPIKKKEKLSLFSK